MTPTLIRSPRSTSGTTRSTVYWYALRPGTLGLLEPWPAVAEASGEEARDLVAAHACDQPFIRHGLDRGAHRLGGRIRQARIRLGQRAGKRQQDVLRDQREWIAGRC